jgi:hypothetical protein
MNYEENFKIKLANNSEKPTQNDSKIIDYWNQG